MRLHVTSGILSIAITALGISGTTACAATARTGLLAADDFPSLQAAVDALPERGGTIQLSATTYTLDETLLLPVDRPVRLVGAGMMSTVLQWTDGSIDFIRVRGTGTSIEELAIRGPLVRTAADSGRAVVVGRYASDGGSGPLRHFLMRRCYLDQTPSWALYAIGVDPAVDPGINEEDPGFSILATLDGCVFSYNNRDGLLRINRGCTTWRLRDCLFGASKGVMAELQAVAAVHFYSCTFDAPSDDTSPFVMIHDGTSISMDNCYFENGSERQSQYFIDVMGTLNWGLTVNSCRFVRSNSDSAHVGRLLHVGANAIVRGLVVTNPAIYLNSRRSAGRDIVIENAESEVTVIGGGLGDNSAQRSIGVMSASPRTTILKQR